MDATDWELDYEDEAFSEHEEEEEGETPECEAVDADADGSGSDSDGESDSGDEEEAVDEEPARAVPAWRGLPFISKYERAGLIIHRAAQLERGAPAMVPVSRGMSYHDQAVLELETGNLPFLLERRAAYGGAVATVRLADLELCEF